MSLPLSAPEWSQLEHTLLSRARHLESSPDALVAVLPAAAAASSTVPADSIDDGVAADADAGPAPVLGAAIVATPDGPNRRIRLGRQPIQRLLRINRSLRNRCMSTQKVLKHYKQKSQRLQSLLRRERANSAKLHQQLQEHRFHRGRKNFRLSIRGGMLLAVRRTLSNVGSQGVGLMMGLDIHGQTVRSWEVRHTLIKKLFST